MRLHIIRHGDPDYTTDSLTELGHREAEALGVYLKDHRPDLLYASSMGRAQQTAEHVAAHTGLRIETVDWARELHWTPYPDSPHGYWDVEGRIVRTGRFLESPWEWRRVPRLEEVADLDATCATVAASSDAFLESHGYRRRSPGVYDVMERNDLAIAVVCHGGFGSTWFAHLLALPIMMVWTSFFFPTTSITTILFEERSPETACPRCIGQAGLPHYVGTDLTMNPGGLKANVR